jgi:hypothetical protein
MFCPYCGSKAGEGEIFCRTCGKHMGTVPQSRAPQETGTYGKETNIQDTYVNTFPSPPLKTNGSIGAGVMIGFFLLLILGWIPIIGALIAGIVAGAVARGAGRGLVAGFISGIIGVGIIVILLTGVLSFLGGVIGGLIGISVGTVLILLSIGGAVVAMIGGLIGGALRRRMPVYY